FAPERTPFGRDLTEIQKTTSEETSFPSAQSLLKVSRMVPYFALTTEGDDSITFPKEHLIQLASTSSSRPIQDGGTLLYSLSVESKFWSGNRWACLIGLIGQVKAPQTLELV